MTDLHHAAATGYAAASDTYARGRPGYPPELEAWLLGRMALGPGMRVVELGAGTGKFTRLLAGTGAEVTAVEPVAEMRDTLAAALPGVTVQGGTADETGLARGAADVVICAQAFHWFATTEALDEIARILRQGGSLGLVWNIRDETTPWVAELTRIMTPYEGDAPRFHTGAWRKVFPHPEFGAMHEAYSTHTHDGSFEDVVLNRVMSVSFIAALPPETRATVRDEILALRRDFAELQGATVRFPYRTLAVSLSRR
ncbi:class I SAM-dependent methyltransferase [Acidimangrovimonas sediminis]|uniref:class I SAM-dependent methyltransferase n=1 Tax=Acidimangrovimonas sediminis TaxID=2056283 RepID=UPI000C7F997F|nr:class I SAM-dependent methyltransferase [Acidimangrovimonas sediminis]